MIKLINLLKITFLLCVVFIFINKPARAIYEEYFKIDRQYKLLPLTVDKKIIQSFNPDSDFGSIEVKTYFENSHLEGDLLFILKDNNKVIYSNIYPVKKLLESHYFPFGFPKVKVDNKHKYQFEIMLKKINIPNKLYLWLDERGNLNYKISGDRPIVASVKFFFLRNIKNDPGFFIVYALILMVVMVKLA